MQLHRNRYDQFFFMCTGGVGVLSGVGVPCAGRLASLRGVGGVMLPVVGWLASLEVLSASVMCQRVAGWLSLRSVTVGGEPVRDLLPTLSVH